MESGERGSKPGFAGFWDSKMLWLPGFFCQEPGESGSDTSSDSGAGLSASPAQEALARAKKLRKPLTSSKASWGVEDGETLGR